MQVLISPNAFKHSLDAEEAASAIAQGLMQSKLDCSCECFPIGDGGDGTASLIIKKCQGELIPTEVNDPLGRKIETTFGLIDEGRTAIIEMANASGLRLLQSNELNPLIATSFGTGQQIKIALDNGARKVIVGMGGSATVDGASGILQALGVRFINDHGQEISDIPAGLTNLDSIDLSLLDARLQHTELVVLCDVNNLLLGEQGAAAMFGPQKGASKEAVDQLNKALTRLSEVGLNQMGKDMSSVKYGGAAGGAAAGLYAFLNAKLVNGINHFLELTSFNKALEKADVVITGEGSIDEQTLQGKGPYGVANAAKLKGLAVIGIAGKVPLERSEELEKYFDVLIAIGNQPTVLPEALRSTETNLTRTARQLGNLLAMVKS